MLICERENLAAFEEWKACADFISENIHLMRAEASLIREQVHVLKEAVHLMRGEGFFNEGMTLH